MCLYFLAWVDSLVGDSTTSFDTLGKVSARIGAVNSCFEASTAKDVLAIIVASDAQGSVRAGVVPIEANAAFLAARKECAEFT